MVKPLVILDAAKLYAQVNIYELIVNWYWIHNLLEDLNPLKPQMITKDNSDARLFFNKKTIFCLNPNFLKIMLEIRLISS